MLVDLLADKIQIIETAEDWKHAIRISAQPLLDNDSIEERYVDAMIDMCEEHNAYIVLTDLFAMPHASPESGVKKLDLALTLSRQPIDFMGKPVQVLLALASTDKNSHIYALHDLSDLLEDTNNIYRLIECETVGDIAKIINETLVKQAEL